MTINDFLEIANDLSNIRIRVFDCESEEVIFDSINLEDEDPIMELYVSDIGDHEVGSYDLYLHNGVINLEVNISYEPEEDVDDFD